MNKKPNPYLGLSFLEAHYIQWRESNDPLAKGHSAHGCYCAYNNIDHEIGHQLRNTYNKWKDAQTKLGAP